MSDPQLNNPDVQPPPQQTPPPEAPPKEPTTEAKTTPETKTSTPSSTEPKSLLNQEQKPKGAPEKYEEFKAPEGYQLDGEVATAASKLFKDMNLTQEQGQQLVDFYVKQTSEAFRQPYEAYEALRNEWREKAKAHPEIGGSFDRVLSTVAKAIDSVGDPALATEFRQVMDMTGAGDHPAFIRLFYKLAQHITEGRPVMGNGPAKTGQVDPSRGRPATAAQALYPTLPSGA